MIDDVDFLDQFGTEKDYKRPVLLTFLCVLTWIGCWFCVIYYGLLIYKISNIERSVYHFEGKALEYYLMKASLLAPVFSLVGSILMWQLKRIGLSIYAAGQLLIAVFGLYIYLFVNERVDSDSFLYIAFYGIQLLFIAFYASFWKQMK